MRRNFLAVWVWLHMSPLLAMAVPVAHDLKISAADAVYADIARQIAGSLAEVAIGSKMGLGQRGPVLVLHVSGHVLPLRAGATAQKPGLAHASPEWLHVTAMRGLARHLAAALEVHDPAHKNQIAAHLKAFEARLAPVLAEMDELRDKYRGSAVFVADPAFTNMLHDLHFGIRNKAGLAALDAKGSARLRAIKALGQRITQASAGVLVYQLNAHDMATTFLKKAADQSGVPSVGIWSNLPSGLDYQRFVLRELLTLHGALNEAAP